VVQHSRYVPHDWYFQHPNPGRAAGAFEARAWRTFECLSLVWSISMGSFFVDLWYRAAEVPSDTWDWFNALNREEWMVTLAVVCAAGFVCMLGFQSRRI
jgi:hypothetical protein